MIELRGYQREGFDRIHAAWDSGHRNVLAVYPTGAGKSVLLAEVVRQHVGQSCVIAHRQELVSQLSLALARDEVRHRIIGPDNVIKFIIQYQIQQLGRDWYDPSAPCAVAGIDTLNARADTLKRWCEQVTLWIVDEGHHTSGVVTPANYQPGDPIDFSTGNKWCKGLALFPNAKGLGVTATPERADGKGLRRGQDGVFDTMIVGPNMRNLINDGYLTDYRIFCPPSDLDLSSVSTGTDGDFVRKKLALCTKKSTVMGHVVEHYLKIAPGKLGITFAPDVETATDFAAMFRQAGVPAEVVTAKTPDRLRVEIMRRFERRELLQLVNVDLFGEGVDVPALEVVTMARATQSYGLYVQMFGRVLRLLSTNPDKVGIIIDHVGNVVRHGLPDRPRQWSLDRREKRSTGPADDTIPMRVCLNPECMAPYERVYSVCPFCGWKPEPAGRTAPELVDGDLCELDPAVLAAMRGEVEKVDRPADLIQQWAMRNHPGYVAVGIGNRHRERQEVQGQLRQAISMWAGYQTAMGRGVSEIQRRFYFRFGCDVLTAQAMGRPEAEALVKRVCDDVMGLHKQVYG